MVVKIEKQFFQYLNKIDYLLKNLKMNQFLIKVLFEYFKLIKLNNKLVIIILFNHRNNNNCLKK